MVRLLRDIDDTYRVSEVGEVGEELGKEIFGTLKEDLVEKVLLFIGAKGKIRDLSFYQILKEVRTEGWFWNVVTFLHGHLDEERGIIDVGVGDAYS
jgi:hypothetical protein